MTKKVLFITIIIIILELFIDLLILFYYNYNIHVYKSKNILILLIIISIRWYLLLVDALEMSKYITSLMYQSRRLVKKVCFFICFF
jgi:hypothetical protein